MRAVTIGQNEAGQRLEKFLNKYMMEAGVSFFYKMMRKKNIVLNGKKCTGKEILLFPPQTSFFARCSLQEVPRTFPAFPLPETALPHHRLKEFPFRCIFSRSEQYFSVSQMPEDILLFPPQRAKKDVCGGNKRISSGI